MSQFPLCQKLRLLRDSTAQGSVVSSSALYELLGNACYQRGSSTFRWVGNTGPLPDEVEEFLQTDLEAKRKVQDTIEELLARAIKKQ